MHKFSGDDPEYKERLRVYRFLEIKSKKTLAEIRCRTWDEHMDALGDRYQELEEKYDSGEGYWTVEYLKENK